MATKRPLNKCAACKNTWYPKGKDLSSRCPECGSTDVKYAGIGLIGSLGLGAIIVVGLVAFSGKEKQPAPDTNNNYHAPEQLASPSPENGTPLNGNTQPDQNSTIGPLEYRTPEISPNTQRSLTVTQSAPPQSTTFPPARKQPDSNLERIYSPEEIEQLEDARQYHGNDDIVRRRLGLPSKETGKLIP